MQRIAIHSVPRSGSTWLGEVFNSSCTSKYCYQPIFSYALKDFLAENSTKERIDEFFRLCAETKDDFICQTDKRKAGILPCFEKKGRISHVVYKEVRYINVLENLLRKDGNVRLICLIRNPLAVLASWFAAPKEFNPNWSKSTEWFLASSKNRNRSEEFYGFKRWVDASRIFHLLHEQYPGRVMIVRYADLLLEPASTIGQIFEFASLQRDEQTDRFTRDSRSTDVDDSYSVFRSNPSDERWKDTLDHDIVAAVRHYLKGDPLAVYLDE
jgi:sulfotransferase family protein